MISTENHPISAPLKLAGLKLIVDKMRVERHLFQLSSYQLSIRYHRIINGKNIRVGTSAVVSSTAPMSQRVC